MGKVTDSTLYNYYAQNKLIYKGIPLGKVTDSTLYIHKHGGRRSIAGIKESFKGNAARARLARGFRNKKISREISCKKFKTHLQFYVKISNKNFSRSKRVTLNFFGTKFQVVFHTRAKTFFDPRYRPPTPVLVDSEVRGTTLQKLSSIARYEVRLYKN